MGEQPSVLTDMIILQMLSTGASTPASACWMTRRSFLREDSSLETSDTKDWSSLATASIFSSTVEAGMMQSWTP